MRYALIRKNDVANGIGVRTTFWVQGCSWRCHSCHNQDQWNFDGGYPFTEDTIKEIVACISSDGIMRDFTILGGEPLADENVDMCIEVVKAIRQEYPDLNIWIYTGYTYETLLKDNKKLELLNMIDVLVDGLYIESLRSLKLKFKGSSNQRIINVPVSLDRNEVIEIKI